MLHHLITIILLSLLACMAQTTQPDSASTFSAELPVVQIPGDSVKTDQGTLAYTAVDRQCGSCHHGDRSTNTGALGIFNLKDECWYCMLTPQQCESLKGAFQGLPSQVKSAMRLSH